MVGAAGAEEGLQEGGAVVGEDVGGDVETVVEAFVADDVVETTNLGRGRWAELSFVRNAGTAPDAAAERGHVHPVLAGPVEGHALDVRERQPVESAP